MGNEDRSQSLSEERKSSIFLKKLLRRRNNSTSTSEPISRPVSPAASSNGRNSAISSNGSASSMAPATEYRALTPDISVLSQESSSNIEMPRFFITSPPVEKRTFRNFSTTQKHVPATNSHKKERIAVVGGGWYGCHTARVLAKEGYEVVLFEKNPTIFSELSGKFGIRLHAGPHYPRSKETRNACHSGFIEFYEEYPELIEETSYSTYALGKEDTDHLPSKTDNDTFISVCEEFRNCGPVDFEKSGYKNLISAMNIEEPSLAGGKRLREKFTEYLKKAEVEILCNTPIERLETRENSVIVHHSGKQETFSRVVNATGYQSLLPATRSLPLQMELAYQPCLALIYEDTKPTTFTPFSFIIMDGWFPCIMPFSGRDFGEEKDGKRKYVLTHGQWTIMGSYKSATEAQAVLENVNDEFIETKIQPRCESDTRRFVPKFNERFKYLGWTGAVLAKPITQSEFRSELTFERDNIIYVVPGKVSNIFSAAREILSIIENENLITDNRFRFVENGTLAQSKEITEKPDEEDDRNTCRLQTYATLQGTYDSARFTPHLFGNKKEEETTEHNISLSLT